MPEMTRPESPECLHQDGYFGLLRNIGKRVGTTPKGELVSREISTDAPRRDRRGLSLATRVGLDSRTPSVFEALDSLASQLLALGWIVRMPRTAWDCPAGVLAVSARAFSPTTTFVHLDADRRLSLVTTSGELQPAFDLADLVVKIKRDQVMHAASLSEPVPA
jgi:hypothetical protein